jgi:hypothetical protein
MIATKIIQRHEGTRRAIIQKPAGICTFSWDNLIK